MIRLDPELVGSARMSFGDCAAPMSPNGIPGTGLCRTYAWWDRSAFIAYRVDAQTAAEMMRERDGLIEDRANIDVARFEALYLPELEWLEDQLAGFPADIIEAGRALISTLPPRIRRR